MKKEPEKIQSVVPEHVAYWNINNLKGYMGGPFTDRSGVIDDDKFPIEGASTIKDRMNASFGPVEVTITPVSSIPSEASGKFRIVRSDLV